MPATEEDLVADNFDLDDYVFGAGGSCAGLCEDHSEPGNTSPTADGKIRFLCDPAHIAYDDPILYPGQPGAAHLHQFFGNTLTNHSSTYNSLRTTGEGSCQGGRANRTGYWQPAMIRPQGCGAYGPCGPEGAVVLPASIQFYYSQLRRHATGIDYAHGHTAQTASRLFPRGLRFIFGWPWPASQGYQAGFNNVWSRTNTSVGTPGNYPTLAALAAGLPSTSTSDHVTIRAGSPSCWDGETLDGGGDGRSHMSYMLSDSLCCPPTHPHRIPEITYIISYSHNGPADFSQWYLSSDQGHGPPDATYAGGETWHTDWFGAWSNDVLDVMVSKNMLGIDPLDPGEQMVDCTDGCMLHDDKFLNQSGMYYITHSYHRPEVDRYLTIPDPPMEHGPGHMSYFGFPLLTLRA